MKTKNFSLRLSIITSILALAALSVACGGDPNGVAEPTDQALTNDSDSAASASPDNTARAPGNTHPSHEQ